MKGVSFQNGVEFKISIEGESWSQGDTVTGKLEAMSRNPNTPFTSMKVFLAESTEKKVKAKTPGAFEIIHELSSSSPTLDWSFKLENHTRITDSKGGLYIVYGNSNGNPEALETLGQLRLNILPHMHMRDLRDIMGSHFRFVTKTASDGKKGWVEFKFDPPSAKEWSSLEQLVLLLKLQEKSMEAKFSFHRAEVDALKAGLQTKSVLRDISKSWDLSRMIHDFNGRLNKEATTDAIENVVAEYRGVGWMPG